MTDTSRVEDIFAEALGRPPAERERYVQEACGPEEELRRRVAALLSAYERRPSYLDSSPVNDTAAFLADQPGERIGRYRIVRKLGEGGCGSVYLAEQEEPVRREVALKVIRLGMDTQAVIARFEAERQALALMDHPNIARVYDAGATETGRPYFVMELVRGVALNRYCDEHRLTIAQRVQLCIQVCLAIQHAHEKGIVHRDLKPSNILVAEHDRAVVPKVIDFGVAKATQDPLTLDAVSTAVEQLVGTPASMSPEQASLGREDVDTRSDIYSLGVLLYELATGAPPFDAKALLKEGWDVLSRHVREIDPPRPSGRLKVMGTDERRENAARRNTTPPKQLAAVRGDLDWIVMKCLEKDRSRRYHSAGDLAADLQRYLDCEPVLAGPPTTGYRLQKLVRRHRVGFGIAAAFLAALMAGLAVVTQLWIQERHERARAVAAEKAQAALREQAEANERKAEREAARSAQVARFLQDLLRGVGPRVAMGRDTPKVLHDILDETTSRLGRDLSSQPEVEAQLRVTLADTYRDLGDYRSAIRGYERAVTLEQTIFGGQSAEVAATLAQLGNALAMDGRLAQAENALRAALAIERKTGKGIPTGKALALTLVLEGKASEGEALVREALAQLRSAGPARVEVAEALNVLSHILALEGKLAAAEEAGREELDLRRRVQPDDDAAIARAAFALGQLLGNEAKFTAADALLREALKRQRGRSSNPHPDLADTLDTFAELLRQEGKLAEAEQYGREALAMRRKLLGDSHPQVASSLEHLGLIFSSAGQWAEAEAALRDAWQIERAQRLDMAALSSLPRLLEVLDHERHYDEAVAIGTELLTVQRRTYEQDNGLIAATLIRLAAVQRATGRKADADASEQQAARLRATLAGPELNEAAATSPVGLLQQVRLAEAESTCRDALAQSRAQHGVESLEAAVALDTLYTVLARERQWPEAEMAAREALALWQKLRGDEDPHVVTAGAALGEALLCESKTAEAEQVLAKALATAERLKLAIAATLKERIEDVRRPRAAPKAPGSL